MDDSLCRKYILEVLERVDVEIGKMAVTSDA